MSYDLILMSVAAEGTIHPPTTFPHPVLTFSYPLASFSISRGQSIDPVAGTLATEDLKTLWEKRALDEVGNALINKFTFTKHSHETEL